ncbi:Uncharacterized protein GBIM_09446 [Gryllus bimaculatus]|nr:Uncharacterized protein GBIM_09446 [Gryllus bimaculatus]
MGAPDGGWGWVVVVGVGITFAVTTGPVSCFGLIFDKWLRDVGAETSDFTFLSGLYFALSFMPGVLARRLLRLFSCRQVCAAGAIMCAIGCGAAALCDSVAFLVVAYSVLQDEKELMGVTEEMLEL